ncbi:zinc metallopeptidase, partial [Salmonella enterica]
MRNIPILFLGIFIGQSSGDFLVTIGLLLFSLTLLFQLFTLPVEFNAS